MLTAQAWLNLKHKIFGQNLYFWLLVTIAVALPLSPFLLSSAQILLALNWLVEGDFKRKFQVFKSQKSIAFLLLLPLAHVIWLLNTHDFDYALHDLKIKLPLLVFPLIVGTSVSMDYTRLRTLLLVFIAAVTVSTLISFGVYLNIIPYHVTDIRDISIFISHIRLGLMICFAMVSLLYIVYHDSQILTAKHKLAALFIVGWFGLFLVILQSITSWVILTILFYSILIAYNKHIKYRVLKITGIFVMVTFAIAIIILISKVVSDFYRTTDPPLHTLPEFTPYGNPYLNDTTHTIRENGHLIYILISWDEMEQTWPEVSQMPYNGFDKKQQLLKATLLRYLASKGLPRDRDGILALTPNDIKMIEDGYTSVMYTMKFKPYVRIYEVLWEFNHSSDPNAKSVTMRLEFGKMALHIIKHHFWWGVGTGDVSLAYDQAYTDTNSPLKEQYRLRAHNQFITFFVTFGVFGFLMCVFALIAPAILMRKTGGVLLFAFIIGMLISMLNEDTLETQAGVTFFISFYSILLFSRKP